MSSAWQELAAQKRAEILNSFPSDFPRIDPIPSPLPRNITQLVESHLASLDLKITQTPLATLLSSLANATWSSVTVLTAFAKRALLIHQLTPCLHEAFFSAALKDAEALDTHLRTTGKPKGPLHGLPFSLKDQFDIKGVDSTIGLVGWIGNRHDVKEESVMAQTILDAGGVLYVKTSVPQASMAGETFNNIIDYLWNPANTLVSAGGSSGGEGALIAARGSPLGIGTDIGASVRVPAAFNGLWGLKPSRGRLPFRGAREVVQWNGAVGFSPGVIAHSGEEVRTGMKALLDGQPWARDSGVVPMPWREEKGEDVRKQRGSGGLVFGVIRHNGIVGCHPPVKRAVEMCVEALRSAGHEVIDWSPPSHLHKDLDDIAMRSFSYDITPYTTAFSLTSEPPFPQFTYKPPTPSSHPLPASSVLSNNASQLAAQSAYLDYWNSTASLTKSGKAVDGVICAVAPFAAARPGRYYGLSYTAWVNALDWSAVAVPVTEVDKGVDRVDEGYRAVGEVDRKTWESYDPEIYHGTPVAVQIVGKRFEEEKVLALGEVVAEALEGRKGKQGKL
ncbi:MAG: hypothetical protein Q9227_009479 [Pyrenula ochraceoflavens]